MVLRGIALCALALLMCAEMAPGQSWEFVTSGDTEGWWAAHAVSGLSVSNGCLVGDITGSDPYIVGPRYPDIDADANHYVLLRMKINSGDTAEFFWGTAAQPWHVAGREVAFPIVADNEFHEYVVDLSVNSLWSGSVNTLRLDPGNGPSGRFEVDYIRVLSSGPPALAVYGPSVVNRFACQGEATTVRARVANAGYSPAENVLATLSASGLTVLSAQPSPVSSIAPGEEVTFTWQVRGDTQGIGVLNLSVTSGNPGGTVSRTSRFVVSAPPPVMPDSAPAKAAAWVGSGGNAVIENDKLRLAFYRMNSGYGVSELFIRNGASWDLLAATSPLSRIAYRRSTGAADELLVLPSSPVAQRTPDGAVLTLSFTKLDADGRTWQGSMTYTLGDGADVVKVNCLLSCSMPRSLLAWIGPSLCPGNRGFGESKSQALFPGLEWLVGTERSSNTLECDAAHALRLVPHPYKITVPVMALSKDGSVAAILWDPRRTWDGANACVSAKFSSPNWHEGQANTLMELFVPSIPKWVAENATSASTAYPLAAGKQLSMECYYLARRGDVLDAVDAWYGVYGIPPMPGDASILASGLATARAGLMTTMWDTTRKGWPHAIGWTAEPYPEFAADLFADSLTEADPTQKSLLRARVDEAVAQAAALWGNGGLASGGGCHLPGWRLPYFIGRLNDAAQAMSDTCAGIRGSQQPDGGWLVPVNQEHPDLVTPGTKELGSCAWSAYLLLRYARVSGSALNRYAGIKALEYMKQFTVPRAAQVWEVPQHAPDILAAAHAVAAYLEGYILTGDSAYLDTAKYWARAGLPFIYTWKASDRPIMDYAGIPVFGCTFFYHPWFGLPVQWCAMVHAYYIERLAAYDDSFPWRTLAEGITRSCIQQMNVSPHLGTYPDSINLMPNNNPNPAWVNPDNIYKCASRLLGLWGEVDVRYVPGTVRSARISTGGRIALASWTGSYQLDAEVEYPMGETCYVLVFGFSPTVIYKNGQPLPKVSSVDTVAEGWSYDLGRGCAVIKQIHTAARQRLTMLAAGTYNPLSVVSGPAEARRLANGKAVEFPGVVTSGTADLKSMLYVQSEDRLSGIRVVPTGSSALLPVRIGQRVEVMGVLGVTQGERYVTRADVEVLPQ